MEIKLNSPRTIGAQQAWYENNGGGGAPCVELLEGTESRNKEGVEDKQGSEECAPLQMLPPLSSQQEISVPVAFTLQMQSSAGTGEL